MAHFNDFNPWARYLVYIPSIAEAKDQEYEDHVFSSYGEKVDAYLIAQPHGRYSLGIRYGEKPEDYLSPTVDDALACQLCLKYAPERSGEFIDPHQYNAKVLRNLPFSVKSAITSTESLQRALFRVSLYGKNELDMCLLAIEDMIEGCDEDDPTKLAYRGIRDMILELLELTEEQD